MLMIEQVHEDTDVLSDHVKCPTCKRGRLCDKPAGVRVTVLTLKAEALSKQNCRIILKCPKCSAKFLIYFSDNGDEVP